MSQPAHDQTPLRQHALQQRVTAVILDAAARVLAGSGEHASMNDVAAAAGVARATVYRYFPSRQALLDRLAELAVSGAGTRLASARVGEVHFEEGVRRAVRALVDVGDPLVVLVRERVRADPNQFERSLSVPLRRLIERAQSAGEVREDVPSSWLTESLVSLVVSVLSATPSLGKEDTIAAIASMFLDGARPRSAAGSST